MDKGKHIHWWKDGSYSCYPPSTSAFSPFATHSKTIIMKLFKSCLLNSYSVSGIMLDTGDNMMNKKDKDAILMGLSSKWVCQQIQN